MPRIAFTATPILLTSFLRRRRIPAIRIPRREIPIADRTAGAGSLWSRGLYGISQIFLRHIACTPVLRPSSKWRLKILYIILNSLVVL